MRRITEFINPPPHNFRMEVINVLIHQDQLTQLLPVLPQLIPLHHQEVLVILIQEILLRTGEDYHSFGVAVDISWVFEGLVAEKTVISLEILAQS